MKTPDEFFKRFLADTGRNPDTRYAACFYFDLTRETADRLCEMVMRGEKRGSSSSKLAYEKNGEALPKVGDLLIITNFDNVPRCVVEVVRVTEVPFKDMTEDICSRECDGMTLAAWRKAHNEFFTGQSQALGYEFTPDMPVLFEDYKLVYKV